VNRGTTEPQNRPMQTIDPDLVSFEELSRGSP